jgi:ABC-2 type transport system ATP-binding protein
MIRVENLTKRYAGFQALNGVSFEVKRGEIVGFLGPNGAGKSTTMRILTGFIPATGGQAEVAGLDVFDHSLAVRRHIGYMPENNPLYVDMRVDEYLKFRAKLKGVARGDRPGRIARALEQTGISDVRGRIIGQLSKGYRQRVGLADALLGDPDLLILDEPTIGLDPVQIRQVRQLIKDLGQRHTILISTHILSEVEMTCSRVIIINRGKVLRSETMANLVHGTGTIRAEVRGPVAEVRTVLAAVPGVAALEATTGADGLVGLSITPKEGADPREAICNAVAGQRWGLRELSQQRTTLEDIFVQVTRAEDGGVS